MPVLGKLLGIRCERCRDAGHRCQAQIVMDGIALCLRCADDEPCVYITAAAEPLPIEINLDPCVVPHPTSEDRRAVKDMRRLPSIHDNNGAGRQLMLDQKTRAEILRLSKTESTARLAERFRVPKATINNIKSNHRRKLREQYQERLRERRLTPVEQKIGGESVWIAPMAILGAEMLKVRREMEEPNRPEKNI